MEVNQRKRRAIKEAVIDTAIGTLIMAPLNFVIIYVCLEILHFNALQITVACTSILFLIAVARKATVRLYFEKRYAQND
jgi:integral membrane sensor domain MASE1